MSMLVEFLNHGVLPFLGREDELTRILDFSRTAYDAPELRAVLITGEAGSGKSRLTEESLARIRADGGLPIHIRLYPDTNVSVVALLVNVLNSSEVMRSLIREEIRPELGSLLKGLRRLARLRAVILLIEDIHLLVGKSLAEFSHLCSALFNDTISMICLARPIEGGGRNVLEPFLVDEITLQGLKKDVVGNLWEMLLGITPDKALTEALHQATVGNPLALRSALRGTLRDELHRMEEGVIVRERRSVEVLAHSFRHAADRFGEGLAVHLTQDERDAMTALSWLGEIFSFEAASALLGAESEILLESLRFKGMIAETAIAAEPVQVKRSDDSLLVFTHSLVHRQFLEGSEPDLHRLISLLASRAPLYSHLPLELVGERSRCYDGDPEKVKEVLPQIIACASYADHGVEWSRALELVAIGATLFEDVKEKFSDSDRDYYEAYLIIFKTVFSRRTLEILPPMIARCLEVTEGKEGKRWLELRLHALNHSCMIDDSSPHLQQCLEETRDIVRREPELHNTQVFITLLRLLAVYAVGNNDWELLRSIEKEFDTENLDMLHKDQRWGVDHLLLCLAYAYETPEEFQQREALYRKVESPHLWRDVRALYALSRWLLDAAYFEALLGHIERMVELYRQHGAGFYVIINSGLGIIGRYLLGNRDQSILEKITKIIENEEDESKEYCRQFLFAELRAAALMCGDMDLARAASANADVDIAASILLDMDVVDIGEHEDYDEEDPLVVAFSSAQSGSSSTLRASLCSLLDTTILRQGDPLRTMAGLYLADQHNLLDSPEVQSCVTTALQRLLAFFADANRRLVAPLKNILQRYGHLIEPKERKVWKEKIRKIEGSSLQRRESLREKNLGRTRLRVIREIGVDLHSGESKRLRGERVCSLLGALVLTELLPKRLDQVEFNRLATGEDDPDHAKKILKVALFRAREAIGAGTILSEPEGLRLDTANIVVDLLELRDALKRADRNLRQGNLAQAVHYAHDALDLYGGEVIFPSLYDSLFEAMRDEYEARIRHLIVSLADRLLEEGDPRSAERLLRDGLMAIPVDEEINELLRESLSAQGFFTEAERMRLRGEADVTS